MFEKFAKDFIEDSKNRLKDQFGIGDEDPSNSLSNIYAKQISSSNKGPESWSINAQNWYKTMSYQFVVYSSDEADVDNFSISINKHKVYKITSWT